jgi:hypothetical protein
MMSIVGKIRKLESRIARSVDKAVAGVVGREPQEPIEIVHGVLDVVEQQIQAAGRGRQVFPFNRVSVHVRAGSKAAQARIASVFSSDPTLQERMLARLRECGCESSDLRVDVKYASRAQKQWVAPDYHVDFDVESEASRPPALTTSRVEPPRIELTVLSGEAERKSYSFQGEQINIGRRSDVVDKRQRFLRANQIVFRDAGSEVNRSVSRRHAHILYVDESAEYRLCDDRSAQGTSVIRNGRRVPVPPGARGTRLQQGDEIVIGQARLRIKIHAV